MKILISATFLILLMSGCNKGASPHDGKLANGQPVPGYEEAKLICTQCHALPSPDQFHPAAWPSIVTRMEGYIRANNKILPDQKQRSAIISYLQNGAR